MSQTFSPHRKERFKAWISRYERAALIVAGAGLLTLVLMNLEFNLLEANLYDMRMARGPQPEPSRDIVLITLDDQTTRELGEFSPLGLDAHAKLLEALERMEPKAIGYLVDMNRVNQLNTDLIAAEWGTRFVNAASRMESRGIPVVLGTPFDVTGEVIPPYPLSSLPHSIAVIHKDGNVFAEDKVTRRALTYLNEKPVFHLELATRLGMIEPGHQPRGSFQVPEIEGQYFFFRYHGSTAQSAEHGYTRVSFADVLNERGGVGSLLRGKILLIGTLTREDSTDFAYTPYSKRTHTNPKLVVHANILDSVMREQGILRAPGLVNWAVTFLVSAFVLWWVFTSTPLYGLLATVSLALFLMAMAQLVFSWKGIWIRESQPLIGIFLAYYLSVPYRLIREYKKRWDYQRKNEVLLQVEELKTNFLSLVTHDLKTPVARIQGLTEVLLRSAAERLLERDRETLRHILSSTEELNRFISSILELSKIESDRLQLRFESKDINQIIERAVDGFRAQSRATGILIKTNLEPMFPIKVDSTLILKVLNNLIDNALKYSPSGSEVRVESKDLGDWVEIAIQDQGIGMSEEEKRNLFTRFFRAKSSTESKIPGTGLGLYLTRYFIEAHQGEVHVESEPGQGSCFKIRLPVKIQVETEVEVEWNVGGLTRTVVRAGLAPVHALASKRFKKEKEKEKEPC